MVIGLICWALNPETASYAFRIKSVPQYGHFTSPVFSIGKYTRGCEFHRLISGNGQCSGKS
jgi:hypothetical protein